MNRILVALDSSPRANVVLATAIDLARRTGAKLRLFRSVGLPPEMPSNLWAIPPNQVLETFLVDARKDLDTFAKQVPAELLDGTNAVIGVAWDSICTAAREQDVDLVIVGSHGYSILDRVLGTTAAKVVNHIDRSVLVVRDRT